MSALFLIGLFLSISGYLITLGISFIGLSYLLVYVGAVKIKNPTCKHWYAALVKVQLHKVLLIIANFYSVVYKNILFNMVNKYIYSVELILVKFFAVISHYLSPFLPTATSLNYSGFGKAVLDFSVLSSALKRTDVCHAVIKKNDEGIKPNLEDI